MSPLLSLLLMILAILLALVNILFTIGVLRRIRDHAEQITNLERQLVPRDASMLGHRVVPLDLTGQRVDPLPLSIFENADWAFFEDDCSACEFKLPTYIQLMNAQPAPQFPQVVAIIGESPKADDMAASVHHLPTHLVRTADSSPMVESFSLKGFPAFVAVRDGRVVWASFDPVVAGG